MSGATCAIFMMTFTLPDEYKRVQCSKVPPLVETDLMRSLLTYRITLRSIEESEWPMRIVSVSPQAYDGTAGRVQKRISIIARA